MRLAVIGAGVIGVTTAYELTQDGHEVTVFERCATAAEGASFANGGLLAPEWMAALASLRWGSTQKPAGTRPWWRGRSPIDNPVHKDPGPELLKLARYGTQRLNSLCDHLQLTLDSHQGMMVVWRDPRESARAEDLQKRVRALDAECHFMPAEQARSLELALSAETSLQGCLVMPGAWSVNCRQFTLLLRAQAQQQGCRFEFGTAVQAIQPDEGWKMVCEGGRPEQERFDGVVLCAGAANESLLSPAGVRIPLKTWQGQSLSATVREPLDAPVAMVHDLRFDVTIARMGQRVRVSGSLVPTEPGAHPEQAFKHLYTVLNDWFPGAIRQGKAGTVQEWSARVCTMPDGLPAIGRTSIQGLWLNTGQGNHGWAMACGSARMLADQVAGRSPFIAQQPFEPGRASA